MKTDQTAATVKGGTVSNWISIAVYVPRVRMIVGMKVDRPCTETLMQLYPMMQTVVMGVKDFANDAQ